MLLALTACGNTATEETQVENGQESETATDKENTDDTTSEESVEESTDESGESTEDPSEEKDNTDAPSNEVEDSTDSSDETEEDNSSDETEMTLEEIIAKTYETTGLQFPMLMSTPLTKDMQAYMLGTDTFDFVEGMASEPMMNAQAHSFVLFTVEEGSDIDGIKEAVKNNVDGYKWICVGVDDENIIVDSIGNIIFLIMDEQSEAIHTALLSILQ